jgi:hypothetical protein
MENHVFCSYLVAHVDDIARPLGYKVAPEQWEEDGLHTVHLQNDECLAETYRQLQLVGELRVLEGRDISIF